MTSPKINSLNSPPNATKIVLFLGYDQVQTRLLDVLISNGCKVDHTEELIDGRINYDFIVSFGYRHILRKDVIESVGCPIFNLHIAYLPYNRGAHPNFWSFYENTPSGVTIHLIDEGVDTGHIVYQRYVNFDNNESTFSETYNCLIEEIETLFEVNIDNIINDSWTSKPQRGDGTLHFVKDLPAEFSGWTSVINDEIKRLDMVRGDRNE